MKNVSVFNLKIVISMVISHPAQVTHKTHVNSYRSKAHEITLKPSAAT